MNSSTLQRVTERRHMARVALVALVVLICAGLAGVFYLYSRPDFLVLLANQVWTCF